MIVAVTDNYRLKQFINLPKKIYQDDPNWVSPLVGSSPESLNKKLNKALQNIQVRLFLALDENFKPVGRIALLIDDTHNNFYNEKTAFLGFYECVDSFDTSNELLNAVEDAAKAAGMTKVLGPIDISTNYQTGFLIDGFTRPTVMTPYNKPYYSKLVEKAGYKKAMDLYAYTFNKNLPIPEKIERVARLLKTKRPEISVRTLDSIPGRKRKSFLTTLYNEAFSDNWGFVPMLDFEFDNLLKSLSALGHLNLNYIAFSENKPVGLLLTVPDLYENSSRSNNIRKRVRGKRLRLTVLGVLPAYRGKGIEAMLGSTILNDALANGYEEIEFSVILENNVPMNNLINREFGLPVTKTFRVYEIKL